MARRWALLFALFYGPLALQGAYNAYEALYKGRGYPFSTPMFNPAERGGDFMPLYMHGLLFRRGGNPYTEKALYECGVPDLLADLPADVVHIRVPQIYFPLANALGWVLSFLPAHAALAVYIVFVFLGGAGALVCQALWFLPAERRAGFLAFSLPTLFCSYPFLFMLDRGNWEGFVFLLSWFYLLGYKRKAPWSWVFLSLAALIKPQAVLLGALPVLDRDWRHAAKAGVLSAVLGTILLAVLPGPVTETVRGMRSAVDWFFKAHLWPKYTVRFNHTIFGMVKGALFQLHGQELRHRFWEKLSHVLEAGLLTSGLSSLWRKRNGLSFERKALVPIVLLLSVPAISFDYTLVHLFPVFFLLVGAMRITENPIDGEDLLPLFCLILAPKQIFLGRVFPYTPSYLVNGLALPALMFRALRPGPAPQETP
jgi:hypothetical protein